MSTIRCRYCLISLSRGSYKLLWRRNTHIGYCCRSKAICAETIREQRNALLHVGRQAYNVFYNISQREQELAVGDRVVFLNMKEQWEKMRQEGGF